MAGTPSAAFSDPSAWMNFPAGRFFRGRAFDAMESDGGVITFGRLNQSAVDEMSEDLRILGFILKKNLQPTLGEDSTDYKLGVPMLLETGGRSIDASYIEGFGAIFNVRVRFPLIASTTQETKGDTGNADSEWEKARRAVQGEESGEEQGGNMSGRPETPRYNPRLVEIVTRRVIESMKNAANLRHLKADEYVVVTVAGPPDTGANRMGQFGGFGGGSMGGGGGNGSFGGVSGGGGGFARVPGGGVGAVGGGPSGSASAGAGAGGPNGSPPNRQPRLSEEMRRRYHLMPLPDSSPRPTMMTIRIKKSDVDELAAKHASAEEWKGNAAVTTYLGAGIEDEPNQVRRF